MFAALAGDFSPLAVDTSAGAARQAPPAMLVALAVGLGSMDMPIPHVSSWEWVNWKFPKAVKAGDTIYARWTLTQKRPPVHASRTGIAVWRVDVHTADGVMCAEGEIGAAVLRGARPGDKPVDKDAAEKLAAGRRRRRRRGGAAAEAPAAPAPEAAPAPVERAASSRRRRRRRPAGAQGSPANGEPAPPAPAVEASLPQPVSTAPAASAAAANPLSRVMKRLRRS